MINLETHWTLGVLVGIPVLATLALALIVVGIVCVRIDAIEMTVLAGIFLVIMVGIGIPSFYPFKAEYHQWRTVEGTVQEIGKRLISADKSMSERYVLKINGKPYGVDDTRASLVKVGDHVRLSCKREWEYASTSGYACRWDQ